MGFVSSSPRSTSISRSYQLAPFPICSYCGGAENAFGANSAFSDVREGFGCQGAEAAAAEKG